MRPRVLLLGGLEPTGRMGLLADVATVAALGGEPLALPTALTAQGKRHGWTQPVSPVWMERQLDAVLEQGGVDAVKVGMLPRAALLGDARERLRRPWWVVDPVVRSSSGLSISRMRPRDFLALASPRTVLTPNAVEAGWLLGLPAARDAEEAGEMGDRLLAEGFGGVVVKGGHLRGAPVDVVLWPGGGAFLRRRARLATKPRGTGCRFASALALGLASGASVEGSARRAHAHLGKVLRTFSP